jgi:uncharacterized membrane protein
MDWALAVRALHITAAALWVGSVFFMAFILGPSLAKAGPAAGPFMMTVLRRGGLSPFFITVALVTVLAGGYTYSKLGYAEHPFGDASSSVLSVGAILAVVALLDGIIVLMPNEAKMKRLVRSLPTQGPPPPEAVATLQKLGQKQGKGSAVSGALLVVALLCMTLHPLF